MKITFVLSVINMAGGVRVVAILAEQMRRRGHDVQVVARLMPQMTLEERLRHIVNGSGWHNPRRFDPGYFRGLDIPLKMLPPNQPITADDVPDADVIIATWWETAEWVAAMPPRKGVKAYFIQGDESRVPRQPADRVIATWALPMHKITISQWLMDMAPQRGCDPSDISLVPNSVDQKQFHAPPRQRQPVPTVGLLYHTSPTKGIPDALVAISKAREQVPNLKLVAFGSFKNSKLLPLPRKTDFTYAPRQDRIRDIYARCDVWLCASHVEGFHLPPLEAMACRCPVVSTRVGGPMDIIRPGVNGYLVDIGDTDALADKIVELTTCPQDRWRSFSDAAYQTAIRYTWDDAATLFEAALKQAVERQTAPRQAAWRD